MKNEGWVLVMRKNSSRIKKNRLIEDPYCFTCRMGTEFILELHHIIPLGYGGDDIEDNTVLLCPNCHSYLHFMLSERSSKYFSDEDTVSDMVGEYIERAEVKLRFNYLFNIMAGNLEYIK